MDGPNVKPTVKRAKPRTPASLARGVVRRVRRVLVPLPPSPPPLDPRSVTHAEAARFFAGRSYDELIEPLRPYLTPTSTVFDIGANAGFFTTALLDAVPSFTGRVVLFEPIENLLEIAMRRLAGRLGIDAIFVNAALGTADGIIDLYLPTDSNIGWITAVAEKAERGLPTQARVRRTEPFVQTLRPDVVKIDVEGFEVNVLAGVLAAIEPDYRPALVVELGWGVSNPNWPTFLDLARRFETAGYAFRALDGRPMPLDELARLDRTTDVLLVPA